MKYKPTYGDKQREADRRKTNETQAAQERHHSLQPEHTVQENRRGNLLLPQTEEHIRPENSGEAR